MMRGLGWLVALLLVAGCDSAAKETSNEPDPKPSSAATVVEVGDDLDRLLDALPADDQLHGYKGRGYCPTDDGTPCATNTAGSYTVVTAQRKVPLRVTVATFAPGADPAEAVAMIVGECPSGPFRTAFQMPRGANAEFNQPTKGTQVGTPLSYGDFAGAACSKTFVYVDEPSSPVELRSPKGQQVQHRAALSNDFYAVGFEAPDADLLIAMVSEFFERAGLPEE